MKNTFDIEKFQRRRIAVHCETKEEAVDFCNTLHNMGYTWYGYLGSLYNRACWDSYKENTAYKYIKEGVDKNSILHGDVRDIDVKLIEIVKWNNYI